MIGRKKTSKKVKREKPREKTRGKKEIDVLEMDAFDSLTEVRIDGCI
jgi:hypothetical protein